MLLSINKTSKFLYNKSILPITWRNRIKEYQYRYVVAGIYFKILEVMCSVVFSYLGMYSYRSVEHHGLLDLAQTCIDVGGIFGSVNVEDIWYGRRSIR